MFDDWRQRRALQRVQPGDGRPLKRFRWWQHFGRGLFHLELSPNGGPPAVYTVDVRHWGNHGSGEVKAQLYLDGRQHAEAKVPAVFPVPGGTIEVATSPFGLKRCHFVTADGQESPLTPDSHSAEGHRARFQRHHPRASRRIGVVSVIVLVVGVALNLVQILEPISQIPPVAERFGHFESPIHLPLWLNITLVAAAALASLERALRLRHSWLDSAGN